VKFFCFGLYPSALLSVIAGSNFNYTSLLESQGFESVKKPDDADFFVCIDVKRSEFGELSELIENKLSILVRQEPAIVCPSNFDSRFTSKFNFVIDVGRESKISKEIFPWPQFWPTANLENSSRLQDEVVLVSGNKLSLIQGELYSLRRQCIQNIPMVSHYGTNWDMNFLRKMKEVLVVGLETVRSGLVPDYKGARYFFRKYPNWQGSPIDKRVCVERYKYSLVIENSADYLSEKLFDAFFTKTLPIYVGPNLDKYGIPSNLVIECAPNLDSIKEGISRAYATDYDNWCRELNAYLGLPSTRAKWDGYGGYKQIVKKIKELVLGSI
jgi:hypothetical protein